MPTKTQYPQECPVFEVVDDGPTIRRGAHVEGLGIVSRTDETEIAGYIGLRIQDRDLFDLSGTIDDDGVMMGRRRMGFFYGGANRHGLRPLTRAAREMLALVRR